MAKTPQPMPRSDDFGIPWIEYVRKIEFVDAQPPGPSDPPCHSMRDVLLDGALAPFHVDLDNVTVDLGMRAGTVVTMHVSTEHVQMPEWDEDGVYVVPHLLAGRHVLTPVGEGWAWEPQDPDDPDNPYTVVSFYAAEVHAR